MMKSILTSAVLAASLSAQASSLTIGVDMSGSNPMLIDKNVAYSAADAAAEKVLALKDGDKIYIRLFGARDAAINALSKPITITRRNSPKKIAKKISVYLQSLYQSGTGQSSTNLIAWLEFTPLDCTNNGEVFVITDGMESSSYIGAKDFAEDAKPLPHPDVDLTGCAITFYGLGAGLPPEYVKNIRNGWRAWFESTGATFTAHII